MTTINVRYQNGNLELLEPIDGIEEGIEFEIEIPIPLQSNQQQQIMLDNTRGLWAEIDNIESIISENRQNEIKVGSQNGSQKITKRIMTDFFIDTSILVAHLRQTKPPTIFDLALQQFTTIWYACGK